MNDHQLEDRIRAAIRVIADEPVIGPAPQRVPVANHRPRRTFQRWVPAVAALAVAVITAVIVINPFPRSMPPALVAPTATNMPIRIPASSTQIPKLSESPLGRPALALVYQGAASTEPGGRQAVLMAQDGQTYRRVDLAEQRGAISEPQRWFNAITLLSPDGRKVAVGDGRGGATDLVIVDAVTGEHRVYPLAKPTYYRLLAWSPDGTRVVMVMRDETRRTGDSVVWKDRIDFRLVALDVETGAMAAVGDTTSTVVIGAHFSPAGGLVVAEPHQLRFFDLTTGPGGSLVRTMVQPGDGDDFASWSKDQSMLVFVNPLASGTQVWFRDAASDSTPRRPIFLADKSASFVGWKSPDEIVLYTQNAAGPKSGELVVVSITTGQITLLAAFSDPDAIGARVAARLIYSEAAAASPSPTATAHRRTPWAMWASGGVLLVLLALLLFRRRLFTRAAAR